jgi:predicted PurR-regulated permease PerM
MGVLTLVGFLVIPSITAQAGQLADDFPTIYEDLVADLQGFAEDLGFSNLDLPSYEELKDDLSGDGGFLDGQLGRLTDLTLSVLEAIFLLLIAPVIAFYLLIDLPKVRAKVVSLVPERQRVEVVYVARELGLAVGGFLRGQLLVAAIVGVMTSFASGRWGCRSGC